jgi:hypothetical protein
VAADELGENPPPASECSNWHEETALEWMWVCHPVDDGGGTTDCNTLTGMSYDDCMCYYFSVCNGGGGDEDGDGENNDAAVIEEFNNAKDADYSNITNLDWKCIATAIPYTSNYNGWTIAKHRWNWWNVTANSRWTYTAVNGNINLDSASFKVATTALNLNVGLFFNDVFWTEGNINNNAINNNSTPTPTGRQIVTGTVRIRSRIPTAFFGFLDTGNESAEGTLNINFHL